MSLRRSARFMKNCSSRGTVWIGEPVAPPSSPVVPEAPPSSPVIPVVPEAPEMYVTELEFSCYWREKDYGEGPVMEDWYYTMYALTNKTQPPVYPWGERLNTKSTSYWCNYIEINDNSIQFGYYRGSMFIRKDNDRVSICYKNYITQAFEDIYFAPGITFEKVVKKMKERLIQMYRSGKLYYQFPIRIPEGIIFNDQFTPPKVNIKFTD